MPLPLQRAQDQSNSAGVRTDKLAAECGGDLRGHKASQSIETPFCQSEPSAKSIAAHSALFSCVSERVGMAVPMRSGVKCCRTSEESVDRGPHSRNKSY